jgi:hypothetical protein
MGRNDCRCDKSICRDELGARWQFQIPTQHNLDIVNPLSTSPHHIFVDCEEPKITVAGWYVGPFEFGKYFPLCNTVRRFYKQHTPLLRSAQFYITFVLGSKFSLHYLETIEEPIEPEKSCGHAVGPIHFVWEDKREVCGACLSYRGDILHIFGEYMETEYTRTGEGFHGENNEYVFVGKNLRHNLVGKTVVIKW